MPILHVIPSNLSYSQRNNIRYIINTESNKVFRGEVMLKRWILAALTALLPLTAHGEVIYSGISQYSNIYIQDRGTMRCMQFRAEETSIRHYQGCVFRQSKRMVFSYSEALMASVLMKREPTRVLVIGLGAGVVPKAVREMAPSALIEVVEIDPKVVELARQYFAWPRDDQLLRTYVGDGRVFVKGAAQQGVKYDIILLDAFTSEYVPEHLMTLDFLEEVKAIANPDAVIGANTFARSALYDHESVTFEAAFGDFYNVQMDGKTGNRVILAGAFGLPDQEVIRANALSYARFLYQTYDINVNDLLINMENEKDWDINARVMTDAYSPANILAGRDRIRGSWLDSFAGKLETMVEESPIATALGFLALIIAVLFAVIRFFDYLVKLRGTEATKPTIQE